MENKMYDVDYDLTFKAMNDLSKYSLNKIELNIINRDKDKANYSIKMYKKLRDSLVEFNFYSKEFDDKLSRLEIMAEELTEEMTNGNEVRRAYE
jgi:hypothetical protein